MKYHTWIPNRHSANNYWRRYRFVRNVNSTNSIQDWNFVLQATVDAIRDQDSMMSNYIYITCSRLQWPRFNICQYHRSKVGTIIMTSSQRSIVFSYNRYSKNMIRYAMLCPFISTTQPNLFWQNCCIKVEIEVLQCGPSIADIRDPNLFIPKEYRDNSTDLFDLWLTVRIGCRIPTP